MDPVSWLTRNTVDCLPDGGLRAKLDEGRPLRVKLGIDPTAPDIHLGFTVVLQKLREFQDLGHTVVLIVGDYTARVGDPSGRSSTRPILSGEEIDRNAETFRTQALSVLSEERLEVRRNGEWLDMPAEALFALLRTVTVARILVREDFAKRYAERVPISLLETVYPLLQGYDSVAIDADVELGGTDQTFNLLLGRDIQTAYGKPEQTIMTLPLLVGTDGEKKMSKSAGNYVGVTDAPADMYGKTMSLPDHAMPQWYRLLLDRDVPDDESPREAKRALAREIVGRFHGAEAAQEAEAAFDRVFVAREAPAEMPSVAFAAPEGSVHVPALVVAAFGGSSSEARRLVGQGAVKVDGDRVEALDVPAEAVDGRVLQVGKRRFARVAVEG